MSKICRVLFCYFVLFLLPLYAAAQIKLLDTEETLPLVIMPMEVPQTGYTYFGRTWRKYAPMSGVAFTIGMTHGYFDLVQNNYSRFEVRHPNANRQWFDPDISWRNKYKNGDPSQGARFPLSKSVLVGVTDFKHALDVAEIAALTVAVKITINRSNYTYKHLKKKTFGQYAKEIAIDAAESLVFVSLPRQAGFVLIWDVLY